MNFARLLGEQEHRQPTKSTQKAQKTNFHKTKKTNTKKTKRIKKTNFPGLCESCGNKAYESKVPENWLFWYF